MKNKPPEPVSHLIEFIYKKYQDETKPIFESISQSYKTSNDSDHIHQRRSFQQYNNGEKSSKEVKAELQEYLSSMKINSILNLLVEKILQEKPQQPHAFAVMYFYETYPNRVKEAFDKIIPIVLLKRFVY